MSAVAVSVGFTFAALLGAILFVLWWGADVAIDDHDERIANLEILWAEQFGGPDDQPAEHAAGPTGSSPTDGPLTPVRASDEEGTAGDDTEEFPAAPATVPDGMPLAVQSALIEQRPVPDTSSEHPHPVDSEERKAQRAADIEEQLKRFDFTGRKR